MRIENTPTNSMPRLAGIRRLGTPAGQAHQTRVAGISRLATRAAIALLALALLHRVVLVLLGWPALNSDDAVLGLMARHIVFNGDRPLFIWGAHYLGPLEAYAAALFFWLFGSSTAMLHLSTQIFILGFLATMYLLGRAAYGPTVALLTLGWLALDPSSALTHEIMPVGGYEEILLFSSLLLLLVWMRLRQPERVPQSRAAWRACLLTYAGIGCCMGLGLWSDPLMLSVILVALLTLLLARSAELVRGAGLVLLAAFLLSAAPDLLYQITHHFPAYFETREIRNAGGQAASGSGVAALLYQLTATLIVGLPALLGSPHVCAGTTTAIGGPAICSAANLTVALSILGLIAWTGWHCLLRARTRLMRSRPIGRLSTLPSVAPLFQRFATLPIRPALPEAPSQDAREVAASNARWWLRGMLVAIAVLTLLPYVASPVAASQPMGSTRYLILFLLTTPLIFGPLWQAARPWLAALAVTPRHAWASLGVPRRVPLRQTAAALVIVLLLGLRLFGSVAHVALIGGGRGYGLPASQVDQRVMAFMRARGITAYYADYWACYRLAFETNERSVCAVRGRINEPGLALTDNHYDAWIPVVEAASHPGYILYAGSATDTAFFTEAARQGLPHEGYQRVVIGRYAIYYYPLPSRR